MKKKLTAALIILSMLTVCIPIGSATGSAAASAIRVSDKQYVRGASNEVKAVWVSFLDFATLKDRSKATFTGNVKTMFRNIKGKGLNTIYMHVRANSDAIYPSAYFPWANWLKGNMKNPGYDPFKIMVDTAHSMNLKIEAWVNPYRISKSTKYTNQLKYLTDGNTITEWMKDNSSKRILTYTSGGEKCLSLNPANSEAINLIVNGVGEIVKKYNVDGIHFDDYFYPYTTGTTAAARKSNVNKMVKAVYKKVKSIRSKVRFGISPQGNIGNCLNGGADVSTWLKSTGYIDYICPQVYWSDQYSSNGKTKHYSNVIDEWKKLRKNTSIELYIGLALYKVDSKPAGDMGWRWNSNNMYNQVITGRSKRVNGFCMFRYDFMFMSSTKTEMSKVTRLFRTVPPSSVRLNSSSGKLLRNKYYQLRYAISPSNATNKNAAWRSSNTRVVKVNGNGLIKAVGRGTAVITCKTSLLGKTATCKVTVVDTIVRLNAYSKTLKKGASFRLKSAVQKVTSGTKAVRYQTSNSRIAVVSSTGLIRARRAGKVYITAVAKDGSNQKAVLKLTVK